MEHRVDITSRPNHRREIHEVDVPVGDIGPLRGTDIEHDHVIAGGDHPTRHAGSDEPGAAGNGDSSNRLPHFGHRKLHTSTRTL